MPQHLYIYCYRRTHNLSVHQDRHILSTRHFHAYKSLLPCFLTSFLFGLSSCSILDRNNFAVLLGVLNPLSHLKIVETVTPKRSPNAFLVSLCDFFYFVISVGIHSSKELILYYLVILVKIFFY